MSYWRWFNHRHHPLLRLALGIIGAVLLVGVLTVGFFALIAFAVIGAVIAIVRSLSNPATASVRPNPTSTDPRVIEGEFVVLRNDTATLKR